jgi:hypothetical protein
VGISNVYNYAVQQCFIRELSGPAVDNLRRAYIHIFEAGGWRDTPEFDELFEWPDEVVE